MLRAIEYFRVIKTNNVIIPLMVTTVLYLKQCADHSYFVSVTPYAPFYSTLVLLWFAFFHPAWPMVSIATTVTLTLWFVGDYMQANVAVYTLIPTMCYLTLALPSMLICVGGARIHRHIVAGLGMVSTLVAVFEIYGVLPHMMTNIISLYLVFKITDFGLDNDCEITTRISDEYVSIIHCIYGLAVATILTRPICADVGTMCICETANVVPTILFVLYWCYALVKH